MPFVIVHRLLSSTLTSIPIYSLECLHSIFIQVHLVKIQFFHSLHTLLFKKNVDKKLFVFQKWHSIDNVNMNQTFRISTINKILFVKQSIHTTLFLYTL